MVFQNKIKSTFSLDFSRLFYRGLQSVVARQPADVYSKIPENEPIYSYLKGSKERASLECALQKIQSKEHEVPIIIGGKEYRTDDVQYQVYPHDHKKKLAKFYYATPELINLAIQQSFESQKCWDYVPMTEKFKIWKKAADLMAGQYRAELNAATMIGQAKTIFQAEIDAAAELIDFFRFHSYFLNEAMKYEPLSPTPKVYRNFMQYRPLDGFLAAITPFNFTAIGGNLAFTPALVGNVVMWKPSDLALFSNWTVFKICQEAGVPPGVVNFVPCDGPTFGKAITSSSHLGGINFTGSVTTFNWLWDAVGKNINNYITYPKLIGECGGKNYHFVHPCADTESVINNTIRSAFEYSGQKCSACSRMYVPRSLWNKIQEGLICNMEKLKIGDPTKHDTFTSAVIDKKSYEKIKGYIEFGKTSEEVTLLSGGTCDDSKGYFIAPALFCTSNPLNKLMTEEIFGPVLTVYVYEDNDLMSAIQLVKCSTKYALTGSVFSQDTEFLKWAITEFRMTAGNFYINDKCTGSVVGQQPFGGSRMSGTNDKAGGPQYVLRFANPQVIKETYVPQKEIFYPYMLENH